MGVKKRVEALYRGRLYGRVDDTGTAFYFSAADFPGLVREPYPFRSPMGHMLQGSFYHYGQPMAGRVVVFDHGLGGGHRSYLKEVELLARHGYLVFAYDHTGCMESGGESTNGLGQSLCDLDTCLRALKADPAYAGYAISVVGHSWGAYACLNIPALHPDVRHVVAISGFLSVEQMLRQVFSGVRRPFVGVAREIEREAHPDTFACRAQDSLKRTDARVLVIHSADDRVVSFRNFRLLRRALGQRPNTVFLRVNGKNHNPNYTEDAVRYKAAYLHELKARLRRGELADAGQKQRFLDSFDWNRMTAQDESVWRVIFDVLERQ